MTSAFQDCFGIGQLREQGLGTYQSEATITLFVTSNALYHKIAAWANPDLLIKQNKQTMD